MPNLRLVPPVYTEADADQLVDVVFENVLITVSAKNPVDAYDLLCAALADFEFTTDTFSTETQANVDTSELWPKEQEEAESV